MLFMPLVSTQKISSEKQVLLDFKKSFGEDAAVSGLDGKIGRLLIGSADLSFINGHIAKE